MYVCIGSRIDMYLRVLNGQVGLGQFTGCLIQMTDSSLVEAAHQSGSTSTKTRTVLSSRGQERDKVMAGMFQVSGNGNCSVLRLQLGLMIFWALLMTCCRTYLSLLQCRWHTMWRCSM